MHRLLLLGNVEIDPVTDYVGVASLSEAKVVENSKVKSSRTVREKPKSECRARILPVVHRDESMSANTLSRETG